MSSMCGERVRLAGPVKWQYVARKILNGTVIRMAHTEEPSMGIEPNLGPGLLVLLLCEKAEMVFKMDTKRLGMSLSGRMLA